MALRDTRCEMCGFAFSGPSSPLMPRRICTSCQTGLAGRVCSCLPKHDDGTGSCLKCGKPVP